MYPEILYVMAEDLLDACRENDLTLALAESCTGGLVAGCITAIPGSSDVLDRGFVTYTNTSKSQMLGVPSELFDRVGAVSAEVARAMAEGATQKSNANIALSVTGIAGPGGGTAEKPVGLVYMACARDGMETQVERHVFDPGPGDDEDQRHRVRIQAVESGLKLLLNCCAATI